MNDSAHAIPSQPDATAGDYMVSALALNGQVRAFACRTTRLCQEAQNIHQMSPVAAVALGRLMTGVLLMAEQGLKNTTDTISMIIRSNGPLQGMTVVGSGHQTVRGYCYQPVVETLYKRPGKLDIGQAVGEGTLTVIKDLGLKEPYMGKVELVSGEIAEDITYYLASSEQTPSAVGLGVLVDANGISHAGGFMVQMLPDATEETIQYLETRLSGFPEVTYWMQEGFNPDQILDLLFGDPQIRYFPHKPLAYTCTCSRERMEQNLIALGAREISELAQDPEGINLECHFCAKHYRFSQQQLQNLLAEMVKPRPD
ncbi:MAG: Hsp33 family molecular chaperone HslO [Eubacteriales bacterium]|nr:Hsp33 family molecular chaperone HslO [Eubacteriales bacterium]